MILSLIKRLSKKKIGFFNKFNNFEDALQECDGYYNKKLIRYIFSQSLKALNNGKYEQDGLIYDNPIINEFILDYLCNDYILKKKFNFNEKIKVLDYGGSFGNLYFSLKNFINLKFQWEIVEQYQKVKLAKKHYKFKNIKFSNKISKKKNYDIVIFNTSFQYLSNPFQVFKNLQNKTKIFIITNLIINDGKTNYIKIENPDPKVYKYTYPAWFLSKKYLLNNLFKNWNIKFKKIDNPPYKLKNSEKYYNIILEK